MDAITQVYDLSHCEGQRLSNFPNNLKNKYFCHINYLILTRQKFGLTIRIANCYVDMVINPRSACAARVTVVVLSVCLSVCLFVCLCTFYSRTTGYETAYERYQQLQCYKRKKNNVAILLKPLRSGDMA